MRVVVVHNYYDSRVPSGENAAVDDDLELLPRAGVEVVPFLSSSDVLLASRSARISAAGAPLYSPKSRRSLAAVIEKTQPDLVHLHNIYPRPGPSIVALAKKFGVPVVQTVHNRRLSCMVATHFRDGHRCVDCVGRRVQWPGAVHACYRGSVPQSLVMAASATVHHEALRDLDHYFAVSSEIAEVLVESGVHRSRVSVKPNPVVDRGVQPFPRRRRVLYAGRLEATKGAQLLLDAWLSLADSDRPSLRVCGAGPLEENFAQAGRDDPALEYLGRQTPAEVRAHIDESSAVAIPSIAGEGMPRVLAEAFAAGRPVMATAQEPIASAVGTDRGWRFAPSVAAAAEALSAVASVPDDRLALIGRQSRAYYDENFHPDALLASQLRVYERLLTTRRVR
jgi:glycosyltransferase involved in cell wall biosynthesis